MEKRLPLPAGTILQGRYRILRQLGHGGFGAVYEAIDDDLNLSFALKETFYAADEELRQAFKREARMLASLSHEAFPRVMHYFTEGEGCFLVMELIPGDDLDKLLSRRAEPFEQEQVLTWADQILDALEDLHANGIIHRDIKPSNLKLTPKGKIKLLDFGIAKGALEGETTILTTVGSMAAATLQYAPLEQVLKASPQYQMMLSVVSSDKVMEIMRQGTNATSDLYALAATLYQLLTKTLPSDAPTRALAIWSRQYDRLIPAHEINPRVSSAVSGVLRKALEIDRQDRWSSATEMCRMLREAVREVPPTNFVPPETVKIAESFAVPQTIQYPPNFHSEPIRHNFNTEETQPRELPKPVAKSKTPVVLYAVLIAVPLFLLMIGIIGVALYLKTPGNNSNVTNPVVSTNFELAQTLPEQSQAVTDVKFSPAGKTFASSGGDISVYALSSSSFQLSKKIIATSSPAFSHDGKYLAFLQNVMPNYHSLSIHQLATDESVVNITDKDEPFHSIKFSPSGDYIYYIKGNNQIDHFYEPYQIPILGGTPKQIFKNADAIAFSEDCLLIAGRRLNNLDKICIWDSRDGSLVKTLDVNTDPQVNFGYVIFSSDSKMIAVIARLEVTVWDFNGVAPKFILKGHKSTVNTVVFSPDGKLIASGSMDSTIKIWDTTNGNLLQTLTGHNGNVYALDFSPDGKTLISGGADKTIKVWRVN